MCHDSYMYVTWLIDVCNTTNRCMWRDLVMCVTWAMYVTWLMTRWCTWHDSFIYVTRLNHTCDTTRSYIFDTTHPSVRHDSSIYVKRLVHMRDMTHSYVRHNSSIYVKRLVHVRDMTHLYVRHDASWLTHVCDALWYMWNDSSICVNRGVMSRIYVTYLCERLCDINTWHDKYVTWPRFTHMVI